jgi:hypothetical protein
MYGGKGAGIVATIPGAAVVATILPNTGGADSIVAVAASVFAGLVTWGVTYSLINR